MRDDLPDPARRPRRPMPDGTGFALALLAWAIFLAGILAGIAIERWGP